MSHGPSTRCSSTAPDAEWMFEGTLRGRERAQLSDDGWTAFDVEERSALARRAPPAARMIAVDLQVEFDENGLAPCVVQDARTGEVLRSPT